MATALGFAKLCLFYGLWTGAGLVPFALLYAAAAAKPLPLLCAAFWLAYRLFVPARPWPALRRMFCLDASPYFASQRLVFAGAKAAAPPADDARMLCFHPHGMLCCGWTVANAGAALRSAGVTCVPSFGNSRRTAARAYARFPVSRPAAGSPRTCCSCCLA